MDLEWLPEAAAMLTRRSDEAAALTAASGGSWRIEDRPFGWRLVPAPGSGYPAARALTLAGLYRRLAVAATPSHRAEP